MPNKSDINLTDKHKFKLLLETIQELYDTKKIILDYNNYEYNISFQKLQELDPEGEFIHFYQNDGDGIVCTIDRPHYTDCPEPDAKHILPYLDPDCDWKNYEEEISIIPLLQNDPIYKEWLELRQIWVNKQYICKNLLIVFDKFSKIIDELNMDYDSHDLLIGIGYIKVPKIDATINYPLITQKVDLSFEDITNSKIIISIKDSNISLDTRFLSVLIEKVNRYEDKNNLDLKLANSTISNLVKILDEDNINILNKVSSIECLEKILTTLTNYGKLVDNADYIASNTEYFLLCYDPKFIYKKRSLDISDFINKINDDFLKNPNKTIPEHFINLMDGKKAIEKPNLEITDIKQKLININGTFEDILLTKPANKEQLDIIKKINTNNVVEVQGPPGTGKTHTIANLLGHFLSQGKRILVVSEKSKALEVIQDKLDEQIQNLCVPILNGKTSLLKKAISGILTKNTQINNIEAEENNIQLLKNERNAILHEIEHLQENLFNLKNKQAQKILFRHKYYSLIDLGKYISKYNDFLYLIPNDIKKVDELPLTKEEFNHLFKLNDELSNIDEIALSNTNVQLKELFSPKIIKDFFNEYNSLTREIKDLINAFNIDVHIDNNFININETKIILNEQSLPNMTRLQDIINALPPLSDWLINICLANRWGQGYVDRWKQLSLALEKYISLKDEYISLSYTKEITINPEANIQKLIAGLNDIITKNDFNFNFLGMLFNNDKKYILNNIKVNNQKLNDPEDFKLAKKHLELIELRKNVSTMWDKSFKDTSMKLFDEIPEGMLNLKYLSNVRSNIDIGLAWFDKNYSAILDLAKQSNIQTKLIHFDKKSYTPDEFIAYNKFLHDKFSTYLTITKNYLKLKSIEDNLSLYASKLKEFNMYYCNHMYEALKNHDYNLYNETYTAYKQSLNKKELYHDKLSLIQKIKELSPTWAKSFKDKDSIYNASKNIEDFTALWQAKQFDLILKDIYSQSEDDYIKKIDTLTNRLHDITVKLVSSLAWFHNINYCQSDPTIIPALNKYILYNRKIGLGKGKYAEKHRRDAQRLMQICQRAVPAWIMSVSEALDRFNPIDTNFDIMIIDEASQSSLNVLTLTYLAKKLIIVGDDKQVSPLAVGQDMDRQQNIVNNKLKGILKEPDLFRTDTSFYDLMSSVGTSVMLCEHFRSAPEIIGYSNKFYYDGKIKPFRDTNRIFIKPSMINFSIKGKRDENIAINKIEAQYIIAIILACIELPEYQNKTFGVISLLGDSQSDYIHQLAYKKLGPKVINERKILFGEAPNFQGDERDIILLSMVNDNSSIRTIKASSNRGLWGQRYNVAVSRAKDQVWVVNSLDYAKLSSDDIRFGLLKYIDEASDYVNKQNEIKQHSDSPFEEEVASFLVNKGYNIQQQYKVGNYKIDIVAFYNNNKIAIECDGEFYHSGDKILKDMEREEILKRIGGWQFIRIRGGFYFKDKKEALNDLIKKLNEYNIYPEDHIHIQEKNNTDNTLLENISIRVQELLNCPNRNPS